ncbi:MAG: DUF4124 domain-containing protein [Deltaproteobacteria bacterium]|nr:DUF4124 domain-containing protein [Deltaproteobacteria bacterium]
MSILCPTGHAERLYTWEDENGVSHISQEAPPQNNKLIDIMDYTDYTVPSANKKQANGKQVSKESESQQPQPIGAPESRKASAATGTTEDVDAEDKACWLKANGPYDVYFIIREKKASQGDFEYVVWEGWVKKYEKKRYFSKTGQIHYDYKTLIDDGIIGDNHAPCKNGNSIQIP